MKKMLAVACAATASALWAMDPIRINFNDKSEYDVEGWRSVSFADATNGIACADGVTMRVSGSKGGLYGGKHAILVNKLQKLYIDDDGWSNPTYVTFNGLKAGLYQLTVYLSSDGEAGGFSKYNPIEVNGTWYHYDSDGALKTGKDRWGDAYCTETGVGTNVLQIVDLGISGSELVLSASRDWGRGSFAAIELREYDYKPNAPSVLSVNVANGDLTSGTVEGLKIVSGLSGSEVLADSWLNVSYQVNDFQDVSYWDGANHCIVSGETGIGVKVSGTGYYHDGDASGANAFLRYYMDDNTSPKIEVSNVPFKLYDVIVYMNNDWNNGSHKAFNSVKVNGLRYSWDETAGKTVQSDVEWGVRGFDTAILGTNALRIVGLSDPAVIVETGTRYNPARGTLAAMQIVAHDYADIVAEGDITTSEINTQAQGKKEVLLTMPAGATLKIRPFALDCDEVYVISEGDVRIATHNNVEPAEGSAYAENYAKINTANVKGLVFHGWKPTKRIISLNVNSTKAAMPATWTFGGALAAEEVPSASWNNMATASATDVVPVVWDGDLLTTNTVAGMTVDWSGGEYGWGSSPDVFRRGWFDGTQGTGVITVKNIPFAKYDVIVYENWDGGSNGYGAPWVNGSQWTYDADTNLVVKGDARWGDNSCDARAELKVNAIRVPDQTESTCEIKTAGYCGNICAVQIVEYCEKPHDPTQSFILYVK